MRSLSLTRTSRAAFATCPFDTILPKSQLFLASVRVLKKRAAHSQASIRIPVMSPSYLALVSAKNSHKRCEVDPRRTEQSYPSANAAVGALPTAAQPDLS